MYQLWPSRQQLSPHTTSVLPEGLYADLAKLKLFRLAKGDGSPSNKFTDCARGYMVVCLHVACSALTRLPCCRVCVCPSQRCSHFPAPKTSAPVLKYAASMFSLLACPAYVADDLVHARAKPNVLTPAVLRKVIMCTHCLEECTLTTSCLRPLTPGNRQQHSVATAEQPPRSVCAAGLLPARCAAVGCNGLGLVPGGAAWQTAPSGDRAARCSTAAHGQLELC